MAKSTSKPTSPDNIGMRLVYDDLRSWLAEAERLGEVKTVHGATWQEDIGMATELVSHSDEAPAVVFDDIPGVAKGFRVLVNIFGGKRKNMTLGFPPELDKVALSEAFSEAWDTDRIIPPVFVETGPIFDNSAKTSMSRSFRRRSGMKATAAAISAPAPTT
jgi:hypothetical protein